MQIKICSMMERRKVVFVLVDIILYVAVIAVGLCLAFDKFPTIRPFQRGFFCSDESIRYPYKTDTVSTEVAATLATAFPALVIIVIEIFQRRRPSVVKQLYRHVGFFLFGSALCIMVTELIKLFAGRLRPHFLEVCQPKLTSGNCSDVYVDNYRCTGTDNKLLIDARKSFPSGHASMISFAMLYLTIYVQVKVKSKYAACRVLCPIAQTALVSLAFFVCISRIQDNMHHPTDVIGGALLGAAFSIYTALFLTKLQNDMKPSSFYDSTDELGETQTTICTAISSNSIPRSGTDCDGSQLSASWNSMTSLDNGIKFGANQLNNSQRSDVAIITGL